MLYNFEDALRYSKVFYNFEDVHLFPPARSRPRENLTARCTEISYLARLQRKMPLNTIGRVYENVLKQNNTNFAQLQTKMHHNTIEYIMKMHWNTM